MFLEAPGYWLGVTQVTNLYLFVSADLLSLLPKSDGFVAESCLSISQTACLHPCHSHHVCAKWYRSQMATVVPTQLYKAVMKPTNILNHFFYFILLVAYLIADSS